MGRLDRQDRLFLNFSLLACAHFGTGHFCFLTSIKDPLMTQSELDRQIASATGESVSTIRQLGFSPLWPAAYERDREPLTVDWDAVDEKREVLFPV